MCQRIKSGSIKLDGSTVFIDTGMDGCQHTGTFINNSNYDITINAGSKFIVPSRMCLTVPISGPIVVSMTSYFQESNPNMLTGGHLIWQVTDDFAAPSLTSLYMDTFKEEARDLSAGGKTYTTIYLGAGNYKKLSFIYTSENI